MGLSQSEMERYQRQMSISRWGRRGQERLKSARVVVAGVGGLGCSAALYLAAAGIGRIILVDKEEFELSNLSRQILGWQEDIGRFKAEAAKEKLEALNPEVEVEAVVAEIKDERIHELLGQADVIIDGQDNWKTRFIINQYCVDHNIPFIHAGVSSLHGQITTINPREGPCLRCIFPKDPSEPDNIPVLGATPALFATLQVMETVKILTGIGKPLIGKMMFGYGEEMIFETIEVKRNTACQVCA